MEEFNIQGKQTPFYKYCPGTFGYILICLDRPIGLQEVEAPIISRKSAHEGGKVVSPMHRQPLPPQEITLVLISVWA
jgi:hypothetical protein